MVEVANIRVTELDERNKVRCVTNKPIRPSQHKKVPTMEQRAVKMVKEIQSGQPINSNPNSRQQGTRPHASPPRPPKVIHPSPKKKFHLAPDMAASVDALAVKDSPELRVKDMPKPVL